MEVYAELSKNECENSTFFESLLIDLQTLPHMHAFDDCKLAHIKSNFGEVQRLGFGRLGHREHVEGQVRVAFLVIFGKEKANGQGKKMNSEEKEQDPIFGVPPQKQKNNCTHSQRFNFHHFSLISRYDYLIRKKWTL